MAGKFSIVLVHGRAAEFEIPMIQSQQWTAALTFALNRVGSEYASEVTVNYAHFGDLWRNDVDQPFPTYSTSKRDRVTLDGDPPALKVTKAGPQPGGAGDLTSVADALLPDWILGPMLRPAIPDVFQYLEDQKFRTATNTRVVQACTTNAADVIVGFSMGSIVGYDVVRVASADFPVKVLITAGSPIGLGPINRPLRKLAGGDTPFPPHLRLWLNIWNDSDVATGIHGQALADKFVDPEGRRSVQSGQNFGRTPSGTNPLAAHDALDYLSSLAMGVALHTALLDIEAMRNE